MGFFVQTGAALHRLQILLIVIPSFLSIGYGLGVLGGLTAQPEFYKQFPDTRTHGLKAGPEKDQHSLIQGTATGIFSLGYINKCTPSCLCSRCCIA